MLIVGQLWLVESFENEIRMFLTLRTSSTGEDRPHVLTADDLDLLIRNRTGLLALTSAFFLTQIVGMWLRDERTTATKARLWVLVASVLQMAATLAVAAGAAFMILLAYMLATADDFHGIGDLPGLLWWGWLTGPGAVLLGLAVFWDGLRRCLLALAGGRVIRT